MGALNLPFADISQSRAHVESIIVITKGSEHVHQEGLSLTLILRSERDGLTI